MTELLKNGLKWNNPDIIQKSQSFIQKNNLNKIYLNIDLVTSQDKFLRQYSDEYSDMFQITCIE